jgi:hypothetical protein
MTLLELIIAMVLFGGAAFVLIFFVAFIFGWQSPLAAAEIAAVIGASLPALAAQAADIFASRRSKK